MIKKVVIALMMALPLSMAAQKFGICNAEEVLQSLPAFTEAQNKVTESAQVLQQEIDRLQKEFDTKFEEFQKLDPKTTSETTIELRRSELQESDRRIQQFRQSASQDLQRQQMQLLQPLQQQIMEAITTVGQNGGYTMIIPTEVPYYINPANVVDVTADVKKILNIK